MPRTFKENRDDAYRDVMLSTDYFAEQILVVDNLGFQDNEPIDPTTGRTPWQQAIQDAILEGDNFIIASISSDVEVAGGFDDGQSHNRVEDIIVQCCRDPAAQDSSGTVLGGIKEPNLHLGIVRTSSVKDPLGLPYMFKREMDFPSDVLWRLHFSRVIPGVRGPAA